MANQYTDIEDLKFIPYKNGEYKVFRPNPLFPDWYEYIVRMDEEDDFDSLYETYNGIQKLTKKEAIYWAKEYIEKFEK